MSKLTEIYTEKKSDISLYANYSKYISVKLIYLKNEYSALVIYSSNIKKATLNYLEFLSEALLISTLMIFFKLSADSRLGKMEGGGAEEDKSSSQTVMELALANLLSSTSICSTLICLHWVLVQLSMLL